MFRSHGEDRSYGGRVNLNSIFLGGGTTACLLCLREVKNEEEFISDDANDIV